MPLSLSRTVHFGSFVVNPQVFHVTSLSFALVNLKPLLPGHVLVSPLRVVPRFSELSSAEVTDLFQTVQHVSRMIERVFKADALNIAVQDGVAAGQSVPHVHAHIIPRRTGDLDSRGGSDAIYEMMQGEEGDIGKRLRERQPSFVAADAGDERKPRAMDEMEKEALLFSREMEHQN